jgi:hypothetical protein
MYLCYPSYRYRDGEKGIESRRVNTPDEDAALGPEWRHHPDPNQPPSVDPASLPSLAAEALPKFPSIRYRQAADGSLERRRVADASEAKAAVLDGWVESPAGLGEGKPVAAVPAPVSVPNLNVPQTPLDPDAEQAAAAELHEAKVKDLLPGILTLTDRAQLMRIFEREGRHPLVEGGRKTILNAINARIQELIRDEEEALK